ncbi:hypothetical protein JQK62_15955, partial [Leptospira santarosai]|nr:hypothetical protein [Leptospira santarosai]
LSYSKQVLFGFCSSPIVFQTSPVQALFEPYRIPNESCSGSVRALSYSKRDLFGTCSRLVWNL